MQYELNKKAKRVILDVLAGADRSLVGLSVENCSVIEIPANEYIDLACRTMGLGEKHNLVQSIFTHRAFRNAEVPLIVLETIETCDTSSTLREDFIKLLKLYKAADIYSCYWFSYHYDESTGKPCHGGLGRICFYEHAYNEVPGTYTLTDEEKEAFPTWFKEHRNMVGYKVSPKFREMIRLYFDSYLIGKANPAFVMLFVVFEMLYGGEDRDKISKKIRSGVSSFLKTNSREKKRIYDDIRRLYCERSNYVHDGESVKWESLFLLRDYVRRVLVKLFEAENA